MLYFPLYTTASLPMMLGPKAQALSYLVPTKYLFLPYSQTHWSEIPYFKQNAAHFVINTRPVPMSLRAIVSNRVTSVT